MMKKIVLYIGADNVDKMVNKEAIIEELSRVWSSFTLVPTIGVFKGERENSIMAIIWTGTIIVDLHSLHEFTKRLCRTLKQECIGVEFNGTFALVGSDGVQDRTQKEEHYVAGFRHPGVAVIECVENRIEAGCLRWWLHCRMRDGTYRLFADIDEESYRQLCEEAAEYELMGLGIEPEWL